MKNVKKGHRMLLSLIGLDKTSQAPAAIPVTFLFGEQEDVEVWSTGEQSQHDIYCGKSMVPFRSPPGLSEFH